MKPSRPATTALTLIALMLAASAAQSQTTADFQAVDRRLSELTEAGTFSGTVLATRAGEPIFSRGYGDAVREWGIANTSESVFKIGSITKQFTAAGVLLLSERGLVKLEARFCEYFADCPQSWQTITVRQLLDHTSGIPDIVRLPDFGSIVTLPTTLEQTIARTKSLPLEYTPGSKFKYGNTGYLIAARIIERVSGLSYAEFVRREIYAPLGMSNSGYASGRELIPRLAFGYRPGPTGARPAEYIDMSIPAGAGSQYSDAKDLATYARALSRGTFLQPASRAELLRAGIEDYSLGWHVVSRHGTKVLEHIGDINGYGAYFIVYPDVDASIVVLSNMQGAPVRDIAYLMEAALFKK